MPSRCSILEDAHGGDLNPPLVNGGLKRHLTVSFIDPVFLARLLNYLITLGKYTA